MRADLSRKIWWNYLDEDLRELIHESELLLIKVIEWDEKFHDYSFIVFPAAKAFEGFLKKIFLDMNLISEGDYLGKRFRLGKALNPNLDKNSRNEDWVYGRLSEYCQGNDLPDKLWETWKASRNTLFHWFPNEVNAVNLGEAEERLNMIIESIDAMFETCNISIGNTSNENRQQA